MLSTLKNVVCLIGDLEQEERWVEVQKKITPWKLSVQEQEPELIAQQRAARLGKLTSSLLVVASLIDKPTNLGGKTNRQINDGNIIQQKGSVKLFIMTKP